MAQHRGPTSYKRISQVTWSMALFFALGYLPTLLFHRPDPSVVLAAMAVIPFGARARSVRGGVLRGLGLGAIAGVTIALGMNAVLLQTTGLGKMVTPGEYEAAWEAKTATQATTRPLAPREYRAKWLEAKKEVGDATLDVLYAYTPAAAIMCALIAGMFAHFAMKRRKHIEDEWR